MKQIKGLITPLAIGSFFLMSVTGVLMFFHLDTGLNKAAHEWLSWLFLAAIFLHVILVHRKSFFSYFKRKIPLVIVGVGLLVTALSFVTFGDGKGSGPMRNIANSLYTADLTLVSKLVQARGDDLPGILKSQGLRVEVTDTSLKMIAARNGLSDRQILRQVFSR